jgi:uncharacterized integral membrane protein
MPKPMSLSQKVRLVLITVAVVVLVIVIMQNTASATTKLLFLEVSMPRALLLAITLALGFLAGILTGGKLWRK